MVSLSKIDALGVSCLPQYHEESPYACAKTSVGCVPIQPNFLGAVSELLNPSTKLSVAW